MSFQGLRGFKDFETDEIKSTDETELFEAKKKITNSSGVMDSHWDLIMVHWAMKNNDKAPYLIPMTNPVDPPTETVSDWSVGSDKDIFIALLDITKAGIGRGEFALWWYYNYNARIVDQKYKDGTKGFDWTIAARYEFPDEFKEFLADKKTKISDADKRILMSAKNPSEMKRQSINDRKKVAGIVYKFLMSLRMRNIGKTMGRQGKNTAGMLQTNVINGASENPSKGGVENENVSDLVIKNEYVEVKAYDNIKAQIKIGKISDDSNFKPLELFDLIFSFHNLFSLFTEKGKGERLKADNIHGKDLVTALTSLAAVRDLFDGIKPRSIIENAPAFRSVYKVMTDIEESFEAFNRAKTPDGKDVFKVKIDKLMKQIEPKEGSKKTLDAAAVLLKGIIIRKLVEKPGDTNMYFNVDKSKNLQWHKVEFDKMSDNSEDYLITYLKDNNLHINLSKMEK